MSGSFDVSFPSGADGEQRDFSPGMEAGFDFGDSEDFGFCDISDELAKELGEGWTSAPFQQKLVLSYRCRREVQCSSFTSSRQAFRTGRASISYLF